MQEGRSNREAITRKNDYWVKLDRKYQTQVRKTRSIVLEKVVANGFDQGATQMGDSF